MQMDGLLLEGSPEPFEEDIAGVSPRPSIDISIPAPGEAMVPPAPVEWLPRSVSVVSGFPWSATACSRAGTQKLASRGVERRKDSILRLA